MDAWSWSNPAMLAGLVAAGIPWLIHWLTRARSRRVELPTVLFLQESSSGMLRWHRIKSYVLLLIRTLLVGVLVVLFARPFLERRTSVGEDVKRKKVVVVVDASASMRMMEQGVTRFARAQSEAAELLRQAGGDVEMGVLLAGRRAVPLLPGLSRNVSALHERLGQAVPTYERGHAEEAIAAAAQLLGGEGTIHVISDFQETDWRAVSKLPVGCVIEFRSILRAEVENTAILGVRTVPSDPVVGEPAEVVCSLKHFGSSPVQRLVRLSVDGLQLEKSVSLLPWTAGEVSFPVPFSTPGLKPGVVSMPSDALVEDDQRSWVVQVRKSVQVLMITDAERSDMRHGAWFLERAIAPGGREGGAFSLVRRQGAETDRGVLETSDVYVIVPPVMLSSEAMEVVQRRVMEGAQVMVCQDAAWGGMGAWDGLVPAYRVGGGVGGGAGDWSLKPGSKRLFVETDEADWGGVQIRRRLGVRLISGREEDVVLKYGDEMPALTVSGLGRGMVVLMNLPLTVDGGDLVGHPMFPSMVHELLRVGRMGSRMAEVEPGREWFMDLPGAGDELVEIRGPDGMVVEGKAVSRGKVVRMAMAGVSKPGLYLGRRGDMVLGGMAVNVDALESDPRPADMTRLEAGQGGRVRVSRVEDGGGEMDRAKPMWPWALGVLGLLLALEMLLLTLWGSGRRRTRNVEGVAAWEGGTR